MRSNLLPLTAVAISFAALSASAQEMRPFTAHDLVTIDRISDPQVSPDGSTVVFVVSALDKQVNRRRTDLWMVETDGEGLQRLTTHEAGDINPRWAPDGKHVLFLSSRSGSYQVWQLPASGGEVTQVTDLPLPVSNLLVSPNGAHIAFTMEVFPACSSLACTTERLQSREAGQAQGRLYDQVFVRHWDTWKDGRRSHIFVMPLAGGEPVDVMRGMNADSPSKPFGGTEEIAFTPDGQGVVFTARMAGREEPWSTNHDLWMAAADGSHAPVSLTSYNLAWDTSPLFSPDGTTLAYLSMSRPGFESDRFRIVLKPWPSGEPRVLTEGWDRSPSSMVWSADGRQLLVTAPNVGQVSLFSVDTRDGRVSTLVREGHVASPAYAGRGILFAMSHLRSPVELYTARADGSGVRPITRFNESLLEELQFGSPEQFTFEGWNNETVYAWLVMPVDLDTSKKYPLAFIIHGGPQGSSNNSFHYRWNPQIYAGAGYAALLVDFHGSTGYGQDFTDAIAGDWGGKPLVDLQKGLAAAIEQYPWIDGSRACALGASYGGYMVNWIAGNWPDRFQCLVNHDGVFDQRSMYFSTEELWFPEWEHGGPYWANPEGHEKHNPALHVDKWRTPMLVIHGGLDYRVPLEQGIGAFTALQRRGIPSQFLYFANENHWVLSPANSVQWHAVVLEWLNRWLR